MKAILQGNAEKAKEGSVWAHQLSKVEESLPKGNGNADLCIADLVSCEGFQDAGVKVLCHMTQAHTSASHSAK